jgi:tRNA(Ile)-lysidine synthase
VAERSVDAIAQAVADAGGFDAPVRSGHPQSGPLLLLCSPGRDSACLLDLAVRFVGVGGLTVLHVDHGLRPESGEDASAVRAMAEAAGVDVIVREAADRPATGNLHAWARGERLRLAADEAVRLDAWGVATAHTRTDLVETALFRLATQPGRRALLAMRMREPLDGAFPIGLTRPLLGISRAETTRWCLAHGLRWREDRSNADPRFARARIRHTVTPVLRALNPRFEEAVVHTLDGLADERAVLEALVLQSLPPGADSLGIAHLSGLPRPLARLVFRELCERALGAACARASNRLDEILDRAAADRAPFAIDVGDGVRAEVRGGILRCVASAGPAAPRRGP